MADKIATYNTLANTAGFTVKSTDNLKQCVTKEKVLARLNTGYTCDLSDYVDKRLVPEYKINPIYDYSYFKINVTLPVSGTPSIHGCCRYTSTFTGTTIDAFDTYKNSAQNFSVTKVSNTQYEIRLKSGKWNQSPYTYAGIDKSGYFYLVLKINNRYFLFGNKTTANILGSSTYSDYMDDADMLEYMKPAGTFTVPYVKELGAY